ncbi:MAG: DUF5056 domain-containing protein [Prevotella sp.]|nr:DUF5056 domain-containing protein [Prevotella sp.]
MNENDNILLEQFFKENVQQQIADDGFTERVMQQLPEAARPLTVRLRWWSRAWTVFCVVAGVVAFIMLQGWQVVMQGLMTTLTYVEVLLRTLPTSFDLSSLIDYSATVYGTALWQLLAGLFTLMVLSVIALSRWAYREVM